MVKEKHYPFDMEAFFSYMYKSNPYYFDKYFTSDELKSINGSILLNIAFSPDEISTIYMALKYQILINKIPEVLENLRKEYNAKVKKQIPTKYEVFKKIWQMDDVKIRNLTMSGCIDGDNVRDHYEYLKINLPWNIDSLYYEYMNTITFSIDFEI